MSFTKRFALALVVILPFCVASGVYSYKHPEPRMSDRDSAFTNCQVFIAGMLTDDGAVFESQNLYAVKVRDVWRVKVYVIAHNYFNAKISAAYECKMRKAKLYDGWEMISWGQV